MKKLILILAVLIALLTTACSQTDYIQYSRGDIPILLTAPHGGSIRLSSITNRDCGTVQCNSDLNTDELTKQLFFEFIFNTDHYPYLLINNIHRQELDVNRIEDEAYRDSEASKYYHEYHGHIQSFIDDYEFEGDKLLILDIHGQAHDHGYIELGYDIPHYKYNSNINIYTSSSLDNVNHTNREEVIRGVLSLGHLYDEYYDIAPSPKNPIPPLPYFNGGYTTEYYSKFKNVIVVQMELPANIRKDAEERKEFVKLTRKVIEQFYNTIK